ncbi:MAG: hypothetical protein AAB225_13855 [Acidobacteriota bacterium]
MQTRTVQHWAKTKGLPVHRYPGQKGRVFARAEELERWRLDPNGAQALASAPLRRLTFRLLICVSAAGLLIPCLWLAHWLLKSYASAPEVARLERQDLVVSARNGKEIFRHSFPIAPDPWAYDDDRPMFLTEDLDGDGRSECLFLYHPSQRHVMAGRLICYSDKGKTKWEFQPGRRILFGRGERSTDVYYVRVARVLRSPDGRVRILVASGNSPNWPCQVALLDNEGTLLAEYWHAGHLTQMVLTDVDGDGRQEAILGGVNNLSERATLVVLDPERLPGVRAIPSAEPFQRQGPEPEAQKKVLLFQKSCLSEGFWAFNHVILLRATPDGLLAGVAEGISPEHPSLIYHLEKNLSVTRVTTTAGFLSRHRELENERKLDHPFSQREIEALHQVIVRRSAMVPAAQ